MSSKTTLSKNFLAYPQNRKELPKVRRHDISPVSLGFFAVLALTSSNVSRKNSSSQIAIIIKAFFPRIHTNTYSFVALEI